MNATDKNLAKFLTATAEVDPAATQPFAKSRKVYVEGSRPDIRVPFREISLSDTPSVFGTEKNPPVVVYDTSGPYTDPAISIDTVSYTHLDVYKRQELMVAYAYDMIHRVNPIGFFGMVLVLEGTSTAVATQAGEKIMKGLNLPKKAFSYLLSHGALDISHVSFYESLVNQITDPDDQATLIHSAKVFYKLYGDIFRDIEARLM